MSQPIRADKLHAITNLRLALLQIISRLDSCLIPFSCAMFFLDIYGLNGYEKNTFIITKSQLIHDYTRNMAVVIGSVTHNLVR